jgi:DNA-binding MarR family transcriptional regulator/YHS domain-containing protein
LTAQIIRNTNISQVEINKRDDHDAHAAAMYQHAGITYYFCALTCHERFAAAPDHYIVSAGQPESHPSRMLYTALRTLRTRFDATRVHPARGRLLTASEWEVLCRLGERGACKMREVASACNAAMSTMAGIIDRLVAKVLVQRQHSATDRRVVLVSLTRAGRDTYQNGLEADMHLVLTMLEALEPDDQRTFVTLMHQSVHALSSVSHPTPRRHLGDVHHTA